MNNKERSEMITSAEDLDAYLTLKGYVDDKVSEILTLKCTIEDDKCTGYAGDIVSIEFEAGAVEIKTVEPSWCSCCSDQTFWYSFPMSYLYDENWVEDAKEKSARKKEEKALKEHAENERRMKEREEQERLELERLQAKYGK